MIAPVALRELLVASRRPTTWRNRLLLTSAALALSFFAVAGTTPASVGRVSFQVLAVVAFIYVLASGFLFTVDCICEERREGTFGLLYLTPLSSWDVIAGKLASTSLQGFFGLVAAVPVLTLSMLAGGVSGVQLVRMVFVLVATLFLSLATGIFASAGANSRRGAFGLVAVLLTATVVGGWVGVMFGGVIGYVSDHEKRRNANRYWFFGYAVLVTLLLWLAAKANGALIGSPVHAFANALHPTATSAVFLASIAVIFTTAMFYLFSAALCTEWYRAARAISVEQEENEHHLDDTFFPGLRFSERVGDDPARWLLKFLQTTSPLFYITLSIMLLVSLAGGGAPSGLSANVIFISIAVLPYLAFNLVLARFCAAPFYTLDRSGFLETLLTTPVGIPDLARSQRKLLWSALKIPFLLLLLASIPSTVRSFELGYDRQPGLLPLYAINWFLGWLIFALHLETLGALSIYHGLQRRKPFRAALMTVATVMIPSFVLTFLIPVLGGTAFAYGGMASYFITQLLSHTIFLVFLFLLLRWAKARIGLRAQLLNP